MDISPILQIRRLRHIKGKVSVLGSYTSRVSM